MKSKETHQILHLITGFESKNMKLKHVLEQQSYPWCWAE